MEKHLKILVATDYSKISDNVEQYALHLAKSTNADIVFLHVYARGVVFPEKFVHLEKTDEIDYEESILQQHTEYVLHSLGTKLDIGKVSCRVAEGNIAREILNVAIQEEPDFTIIGTHDGSPLKEKFFGGHTWDVIKHAALPVLAIPPEACYSKMRHIVFATEYKKSEISLIDYITTFAKLFDAKLTILHVAKATFPSAFDAEMFEMFKREIRSKIKYDKLDICLVKSDSLIDGLNDFCMKAKANWLVMSHEKTFFLASLFSPLSFTKKMSFNTHIPLFAVPDGYIPEGIRKKTGLRQSDAEYK